MEPAAPVAPVVAANAACMAAPAAAARQQQSKRKRADTARGDGGQLVVAGPPQVDFQPAAAAALVVDGGMVLPSPDLSVWPRVPPLAPGSELISVALTFQGKRKLVRHLCHTLVGDLLRLHPVASQPSRLASPLVLVDRDGFEVGSNVPLGTLARRAGASGMCQLLELTLQTDDWGGA